MKTILIFVFISLFSGFSGISQIQKKERKARQQLEMGQLIESGTFRFVARSAQSELGVFDNLSSGYELVFDGLLIKAHLPYYGRTYSPSFGSEGGVKFDLKAESINKKWNEKKKLYTLSTELSDKEDTYTIYLTAGLNGFADLKINFRDRSWISYYGTIVRLDQEDK